MSNKIYNVFIIMLFDIFEISISIKYIKNK